METLESEPSIENMLKGKVRRKEENKKQYTNPKQIDHPQPCLLFPVVSHQQLVYDR